MAVAVISTAPATWLGHIPGEVAVRQVRDVGWIVSATARLTIYRRISGCQHLAACPGYSALFRCSGARRRARSEAVRAF